MTPHVWLVPVEPHDRQFATAADVLHELGAGVDVVRPESVRQSLEDGPPDAVVIHGGPVSPLLLDVQRWVRDFDVPTMVLVEGLTDDYEAVLLDRGVQDVVELPVSRRKLGSRVRAMGRTMQLAIARRSAIDEIHVGADVLITPGTRSVKVGEAEVNLTLSEFEVLLTLAHRKGEVLTKSQIIQSLGRDATVRALDTHISRLRAKLRLAGAGEIIETAHGVGYRLTGGPPEI